jgi:hypothetical protein
MLFHLPLASRPLAETPRAVEVMLPGGILSCDGSALTFVAGMHVELVNEFPVGGRFGVLGERPLANPIVDPTRIRFLAEFGITGTPPTAAAGVAVVLTDTRSFGGRFGVLGERPLANPIIDPVTISGPPVLSIRGTPAEGFARRRRPSTSTTVS